MAYGGTQLVHGVVHGTEKWFTDVRVLTLRAAGAREWYTDSPCWYTQRAATRAVDPEWFIRNVRSICHHATRRTWPRNPKCHYALGTLSGSFDSSLPVAPSEPPALCTDSQPSASSRSRVRRSFRDPLALCSSRSPERIHARS